MHINVIQEPARKILVKRGIQAEDCMEYCEEVGCAIWNRLKLSPSLRGEPVCLWLPRNLIPKGTSIYVQGVEKSLEYQEKVPEGFDMITLPEAQYLEFIGDPFKEDERDEAIAAVQEYIDKYNPAVLGFQWDDTQPRVQLEPKCDRGYIELRAVKCIEPN